MKNFSCSFARLYGDGGFYEEPEVAQAFVDVADECRWIANLYPATGYGRPEPANVLCRDDDFAAELYDHCRTWNGAYSRGPSSDLFVVDNGLIFNRSVYKAFGDTIVQMYETNKINDRPWRTNLDIIADLARVYEPSDPNADFFYLGSIGSENYGHWLVDDLTRARSLLDHFSIDHLPVIVLNAYNPIIDAVREQSLRALFPERTTLRLIFLDYRQTYFFPRLLFVTPSSYHPLWKSPPGIAFLRDHFVERAAHGDRPASSTDPTGRHVFVTRRALWRNIVNLEYVIDYFRALHFTIIELDGLTFMDQVRLFSAAQTIVGAMGAGMTNTVFCPEGANVVHLAPDGLLDPFFWDLAAVKRQRYSLAFCTPADLDPPAFASYTVERSDLDAVKSWL